MRSGWVTASSTPAIALPSVVRAAKPTAAAAIALEASSEAARRAGALRLVLHAVWLSRALVWVAGVGAFAAWGSSPRAPGFDPEGLVRPFGGLGNALVAPGARWDAVWYLSIARDGYGGGAA